MPPHPCRALTDPWRVDAPYDPAKSAAETESALEAKYRNLSVLRYTCHLEPDALRRNTNRLEAQEDAEVAYALEAAVSQRTTMVLARALEMDGALAPGLAHGEAPLKAAWRKSHASLLASDGPFLPDP